MRQHLPEDFSFCIVSFHEQTIGAHTYINRARKDENVLRGYHLLAEVLNGFSVSPVLPFDAAALAVFHELQSRQLRIATMDLRIAAIALSRQLTLLTRNTVDFEKFFGLNIEDWTR
jgi:tRNA(fMet)-specific endonuclease VapC